MKKFGYLQALACLVAAPMWGCGTSSSGTADDALAADGAPTSDGSTGGGGDGTVDGAVGVGADAGAGTCEIAQGPGLQADLFPADALAEPITEVDCTLDDGSASRCYRIVIKGEPATHEVGPFCPRNITDTDEVGGIWIESGAVFPLDGAFIAGLATFYNDDAWQLYDAETGAIRVTETEEACRAAAQPQVAAEYQNYCVECRLEWLGGGVASTYLVPVVPVPRDTPAEIGNRSDVGVALTGIGFAPPAPVDAILAAHTIAAFDDCGGHVNPNAGYHYHAATGCSTEEAQCDGHAAVLGYALDGYAIHAMTDASGIEPADLDACRGHTDAERGYHYHAASAGENMFIGCYHGRTIALDNTGGPPDVPDNGTACADENATMCCGDGICDGPETPATCAADCP